MRLRSLSLLFACLVMAASTASARESNSELRKQVMESERAFAATMKARDFDGFARFVADEAIFFGTEGPLRGKQAITKGWRQFYDKPQAPFSWEPEEVEVVESGTLAYSGGPIYNPAGQRIGRFNSIWRLRAPGQWEVVFDRGSDFGAPQPATKK
jgi:ketosteroid isomerase-like protein